MNLGKVLICLVLVVAICSPAGAWAQGKKIKVGYSSDAPGSLVTWLAQETGIFAKNGLEAELVRTRTTIGVMALLSGELDLSRLRVRSLSKAISEVRIWFISPAAWQPSILFS